MLFEYLPRATHFPLSDGPAAWKSNLANLPSANWDSKPGYGLAYGGPDSSYIDGHVVLLVRQPRHHERLTVVSVGVCLERDFVADHAEADLFLVALRQIPQDHCPHTLDGGTPIFGEFGQILTNRFRVTLHHGGKLVDMQRILLLVALAIALVSCGSNDLPVSDEPSGTGQNPEPTAVTAEATTAPITTAPTTAVGTESDGDSDGQETDELFPDVVAVNAIQADDGTYRFDVTLSSPYDSPERYADGWRILGPDGTELGVRFLTHDHASEQPFTTLACRCRNPRRCHHRDRRRTRPSERLGWSDGLCRSVTIWVPFSAPYASQIFSTAYETSSSSPTDTVPGASTRAPTARRVARSALMVRSTSRSRSMPSG
ncbi:hypothetical protein GQR58_030503 [Nymphon striatum]|nr:hypothetical protein GQR58_030503 [Nymphon striatum]